MNLTQNSLCTFCNNSEETLEHLFLMCPEVEKLWEKVEKFISDENTKPYNTVEGRQKFWNM